MICPFFNPLCGQLFYYLRICGKMTRQSSATGVRNVGVGVYALIDTRRFDEQRRGGEDVGRKDRDEAPIRIPRLGTGLAATRPRRKNRFYRIAQGQQRSRLTFSC